ncbi:unnamed protein product, partial [Mesorhabditis spiculigera]
MFCSDFESTASDRDVSDEPVPTQPVVSYESNDVEIIEDPDIVFKTFFPNADQGAGENVPRPLNADIKPEPNDEETFIDITGEATAKAAPISAVQRNDLKRRMVDEDSEDSDNQQTAQLDEHGEQLYDVEAIIAKRKKRNRVEYLVKWKNYDEETWEPTPHLRFCKDAIAAFERMKKQKKARSTPSSTRATRSSPASGRSTNASAPPKKALPRSPWKTPFSASPVTRRTRVSTNTPASPRRPTKGASTKNAAKNPSLVKIDKISFDQKEPIVHLASGADMPVKKARLDNSMEAAMLDWTLAALNKINNMWGEVGHSAALLAGRATQFLSRRSLPKAVNLPRYLWDMDDLDKKSNGEYTHKPLQINRLGGRHPETGRKINQHIGGGHKFDYFMVDFHRRGPAAENEFYEERVLEVRRDANRSSHIALLAGAKGKRWILATENMKAGQILTTTCYIPENPLIGREGCAYPLGALAVGTQVNSIERHPNYESDSFVKGAGEVATIVRHQEDYTIIRMPYKHEYSIRRECMATVGRLSHGEFKEKIYGSANMHRRFGYKMSSGLFHKKDGYCGRKNRPDPPVRVLEQPPDAEPEKQKFTLTNDQLTGLYGHAKVHNLLPSGYSGRPYPD